MASSLAGSNRRMMVRSFSKLFWNGVLDRIISFFGTKFSKKVFQIAIFGRLLLNFVPKSYLIILSGSPFQNNFGELRTIMRLLLLANDEAVVFLNPLTLDNVTYRRVDEIRKKLDQLVHIHNGGIFLINPLKRTKRISCDSGSCS